MATWRELIGLEMAENSETMEDSVCCFPPDCLDVEFYDGYGGAEGPVFTLWTEKYVYFPITYDGSEWVSSVPRDPCDVATSHFGGE